jgi:hypothetical protein
MDVFSFVPEYVALYLGIWLAKEYSEDTEFALELRMLPALGFIPKDDVMNELI